MTSVPASTLAFSRVGSTLDLDGDRAVEAALASGNVASVTRRRSSRNLACRRRFEARPFGVFDHARLRRWLPSRRRSAEQPRQHAPTAAHDPQNAWISPQPTHRPNRPSNASPLPYGAAGHARRSRPRFHLATAFSDALATKARVIRPGPSPFLRRPRSTSSRRGPSQNNARRAAKRRSAPAAPISSATTTFAASLPRPSELARRAAADQNAALEVGCKKEESDDADDYDVCCPTTVMGGAG
jgi:hypothetical protein